AVVADDELDDLPDAVPGAVLDLGALDAPRRVHDVRMANAEAVAEQLDAAAAAGRLDLRRLEARRAPEAFGDDRREGINRRRADDIDIVAGDLRRRRRGRREREQEHRGRANERR